MLYFGLEASHLYGGITFILHISWRFAARAIFIVVVKPIQKVLTSHFLY